MLAEMKCNFMHLSWRGAGRGQTRHGGGRLGISRRYGAKKCRAQRLSRPHGFQGCERPRPAAANAAKRRLALRLHHPRPARVYQIAQDRRGRAAGLQGDQLHRDAPAAARRLSRDLLLLALHDGGAFQQNARLGSARRGRLPAPDRSPPAGPRPPDPVERPGDGLFEVLSVSGRLTRKRTNNGLNFIRACGRELCEALSTSKSAPKIRGAFAYLQRIFSTIVFFMPLLPECYPFLQPLHLDLSLPVFCLFYSFFSY